MEQMTEKPCRIEPAGCTSTGLLKLIALISMVCDHFGKMLAGRTMELRVIGRIAFPVYCWCLVVGAVYTRSMPRYLKRMLLLFAVSQPFYMVALNHGWTSPNIFLTLALGLIALWGLREKRYGSQFWAPVLAVALAQVTGANYGWKGILFICLLWGVRGSRTGIACVMAAFCLYWGTGTSQLKSLFGLPLGWVSNAGGFKALLTAVTTLQFFAILALPLIIMQPKGRLASYRMSPALSYCIYPAHLLLLIVCELIPQGGAELVWGRVMGLVVQPVLALFGLGA